MKRASVLPIAILAIVFSGIVGAVLFRVAADQTPHRVVLKWDPPAPKPGITVAGYNVYRVQSEGPFKKVAGVIAPTYTDDKVASGNTYSYYVRAVDPAGDESPASNHAEATIP